MIQVLLVDDQALFRKGLAALLAMEDDFEIVGQGGNGEEAIALTEELQPQVVLMDVRMPKCNGVMATKSIHQHYPWIRILVLSTFDEDEYVYQALQAGALGYILKDTPVAQIADAIRAIHLGYSQLGPTIAPKVFAQMNPIAPPENKQIETQFTTRELDVLRLLGQGMSNAAIAQALHLSEGTVKNYNSRIVAQLGVQNRTQAALWAQQNII